MRELVSEPSWYGLILLLNEMNGGGASMGVAMEKIVVNNYIYWKLCMEAYLQGQDLWDLIGR